MIFCIIMWSCTHGTTEKKLGMLYCTAGSVEQDIHQILYLTWKYTAASSEKREPHNRPQDPQSAVGHRRCCVLYCTVQYRYCCASYYCKVIAYSAQHFHRYSTGAVQFRIWYSTVPVLYDTTVLYCTSSDSCLLLYVQANITGCKGIAYSAMGLTHPLPPPLNPFW